MVLTALGGRVHAGQQHTGYVVLLSEGTLIVEMTVPSDGLTINLVRHGHRTCYHLVLRLLDVYNSIRVIIVTPSGEEQRVGIVIGQVIAGSIVNREQGLERQTFHQVIHVIVDTSIKLELTAYLLRLTTEVAVCNSIFAIIVCTTTREPLSTQQVQRLAEGSQRLAGIGVNHREGKQRGCTLWEVRTHGSGLTPEVTLVLIFIIIGSTNVSPTSDELVHNQVHVTTNAEAVGVVVLGFTEVNQVLCTIVVDVRVEVSTRTTTLNLNGTLRTVIGLADILVRIPVYIRIAIRIGT